MRNCIDYISLFFVFLYNSLLFIASTFGVIAGIILLIVGGEGESFGHAIASIIGIVFLVSGIIIIPCYCCGCFAVTNGIIDNSNNIKKARLLLFFNIITMIFWFVFLLVEEIKDDDKKRNDLSLGLMIICAISIVSSILLIKRNFGYSEIETEIVNQTQINQIELVIQQEPGQIHPYSYPNPSAPQI